MTSTNEPAMTPARERLYRLRAELAAQEGQPEQTANSTPAVQPGDVVHCLDDHGLVIPRGTQLFGGEPALQVYRGDSFSVTAGMIEASRDSFGRLGWPAWLHDEAEQVRRWGKVRLRAGAAPANIERWVYGSPEWTEAREQARKAAWAETDPDRRAAARRAVEDKYGPAPTTSTTLNSTPDPSIKQAEEQQARIAASGVKLVSHYEAQEPGVKR